MSLGRRPRLLPRWSQDRLWTAARAVPSFDQDFASTRSLVDRISGQQLITFTRASSATVVGPTGAIETVTDNVPRFQHDPTTGRCLGLLVEEQRVNLLLNSATLSTQSVTSAATAYTLSFYGTGTITLTGTSTAGPLVGTGANARVSLTFTPTAGTLTLTVSGSVTNANLEAGSFATSWIPTTGTSATRSADVASVTGTAFSRWYSATGSTVFVDSQLPAGSATASSATRTVVDITDGTASNRLAIRSILNATLTDQITVRSDGGTAVNFSTTGSTVNASPRKIAAAYQASDSAASATGSADSATSDTGAMPLNVNQLIIGSTVLLTATNYHSGTISRLTYWPARLSNATLQALTR